VTSTLVQGSAATKRLKNTGISYGYKSKRSSNIVELFKFTGRKALMVTSVNPSLATAEDQ